MPDCLTCYYNQHPEEVPGGHIKAYQHWILEHICEPIPVAGWLVLKTKRHTEGIIGLNEVEGQELGEILTALPSILQQITCAEKIYMICMTELVEHLHIHLIPRNYHSLQKGPKLIQMLEKVRMQPWIAADIKQVIPIINQLKQQLNS